MRLGVRRRCACCGAASERADGLRHPASAIVVPGHRRHVDRRPAPRRAAARAGARRAARLPHADARVVRVRAVYWFHPGVWWVARRLRVERELACDDRVLPPAPGRAYAGHLLEIAYSLGRDRAPALAVSMARPASSKDACSPCSMRARNRASRPSACGCATSVAAARAVAGRRHGNADVHGSASVPCRWRSLRRLCPPRRTVSDQAREVSRSASGLPRRDAVRAVASAAAFLQDDRAPGKFVRRPRTTAPCTCGWWS